MVKTNLFVSFSGGRTSAYMSYKIKTELEPTHNLHFVFANTGKEREETLVFVDRCSREWGLNVVWLEAEISPERGVGTRHRVVSFETASRNGQPFEAMIAKYGMPNANRPYCTRELKMRVMDSYRKSIDKDAKQAIGIRMDEFDRINPDRKEIGLIYPLISIWPSTKQDVMEFWGKQPFGLQIESYQGNCDLCFKKADRKLIRILTDEPHRAQWWAEMEKKYGHVQKETQNRVESDTFYRKYRGALDLLEMAKLAAKEPKQLSIFQLFDGLDACGSGESCEAY